MSLDSKDYFSRSFDEQDGYDPFGGAEAQDADEETVDCDLAPSAADRRPAGPAEERPARERIADLLDEMKLRRRIILSLIDYMAEPRSAEELAGKVEELQEHDRSVYTSANFCRLLNKAGAIERVNAEGLPVEGEGRKEPESIVIDNVEYYRPATPDPVYWMATPDGAAAVAENDPAARLVHLLEEDGKFLPIYDRILQFCNAEGGRVAGEIAKIVDDDPLVKQKPRLYAPYFTDRLEQCEAILWNGAWVTTEVGLQGIEYIDGLAGEPAANCEE